MPDHPSTTQARPNTIAEAHAQNSPDAHPTSIQAQSQPLPSHPAKHPPHFTAGNSFGPYLFEGLTTNRPHPQFLGSISDPALVKLDVPHYLYAHRTHAPTFASSNATVDTFRYYLCASLARHHGYRHAYLTEATKTTTTTHSYRSSYKTFERRFTESLQSILNNEEINPVTTKEQTELVTPERDLTHETFATWPRLFDRCSTANETLLRSLELQAPTLLHVLGSRQHPRAFLQCRMRHLQDAWIDLADGPDVLLRRRHPRR